MKYPIIKYRKIWFALSGVLVAASVTALVMYPLRLGIDFTGGSLMELKFSGERPAAAEMRDAMDGQGYSEALVQPLGDDGMLVRLQTLGEEEHQASLIALRDRFGGVEEMRFESIGPTVGAEMRSKALWSLSLVLIAIAAYVAYAFRKVSRPVASWKYGITTLIAAVLHDVLIPLGVFAILGKVLMVEINSAFIAAMLTVLGFSVHDTIVVFDRVRENLLKTSGSFQDIVERSVNETLARSINTTVTTLLPLLAIWLWGGETLKWFSLALMIGLVAGTYSSIFLASPLLVVFQKSSKKR
ncbi:MAG: protein translocase subunit SecF [Patescibacteria group bacterium]|nr:protein translocase subunit SecF [Patescibacteria group bacterium]